MGPHETPHTVTEPDRNHKLVLVVDDHHDSADSLALLLQLMGHDARVANDGPAALRIVEEEHPDVLLLDIGLPGMNGYEIARRIREMPDGARVRLIALSGFGKPEAQDGNGASPFDAYVVKPAELETLEAALAAGAPGSRAARL